jgi:hypothetical protein
MPESFAHGGRRECRALDAPASAYAMVVVERTRVRQVTPESPGIPHAMVYSLYRALPGVPGFLATVAGGVASADLTPASGCQDHTILPSASGALVRSATRVHRIPPRVDDDGQRPSVGRDGLEYRGDLYSGKQKYFCKQDWTGQITLKSKANFFSGSMPDSRLMTAPCELQHVRRVVGSGAATGRVLHRWRCVMRKVGDFENLPSFQHHA